MLCACAKAFTRISALERTPTRAYTPMHECNDMIVSSAKAPLAVLGLRVRKAVRQRPADHGHGQSAVLRVGAQIAHSLLQRGIPRRARSCTPAQDHAIVRYFERQRSNSPCSLERMPRRGAVFAAVLARVQAALLRPLRPPRGCGIGLVSLLSLTTLFWRIRRIRHAGHGGSAPDSPPLSPALPMFV